MNMYGNVKESTVVCINKVAIFLHLNECTDAKRCLQAQTFRRRPNHSSDVRRSADQRQNDGGTGKGRTRKIEASAIS